jgi:hypothetical protein
MRFLFKTRQHLRQSLRKYFCLRMRFRGSVLVTRALLPSAGDSGSTLPPPLSTTKSGH